MKKMTRFIFDVDGTLTPSRQTMDPEFKEFFLDFMTKHKVWLVTGSDYPKTKEQLGADITENVVTCYNCSGNETRHKGKIVSASGWEASDEVKSWLNDELLRSPFMLRTGNHIEHRRGTCNFSIVGRNDGYAYKNSDISIFSKTEDKKLVTPISEGLQGIIWHCLVSDTRLQDNKTK